MSSIDADFSGKLAKTREIGGKKQFGKNVQKPTINSSHHANRDKFQYSRL